MKIHKQDNGKLTEADAMTVAGILLRAGYTVSVDYDKTKKQCGLPRSPMGRKERLYESDQQPDEIEAG